MTSASLYTLAVFCLATAYYLYVWLNIIGNIICVLLPLKYIDDLQIGVLIVIIWKAPLTILSEHAEKFGYGVVDRFVGHGIGTVFHSEPLILHHRKYHLWLYFFIFVM